MQIQSLKLVCFSPTGTTKVIIQAIARGINNSNVEFIDITKPEARLQLLQMSENELLIVAVPVYMGRVPSLLTDWLNSIKAQNTPTVCVVVYGNRAYDNALLELKNVLLKCGCKPFAGAAFIGEHSFSSDELPSSIGRPDSEDLLHAETFGGKIRDKLQMYSSVNQISDIHIPGSYPYGGITDLWHIDFISMNDKCIRCGICADGCPVGAIDPLSVSTIYIYKCTLCCACIKKCPQHAKSMKPGLMKDAAIRCTTFIERKEPISFI